MSEAINKVLVNLPMGLAESAKKMARDNIGAYAASGISSYVAYSAIGGSGSSISSIGGSAISGQGMDTSAVSAIASAYAGSAASSKFDKSASGNFYPSGNPSSFVGSSSLSAYIPYSAIGGSGSSISSINGSALSGGGGGGIAEVTHDANLSGSGTPGSPLGLSMTINLSASGYTASAEINPYHVAYNDSGNSAYTEYGHGGCRLSDNSAHLDTFVYAGSAKIAGGDNNMSISPSALGIYENNGYKSSAILGKQSLTFTSTAAAIAHATYNHSGITIGKNTESMTADAGGFVMRTNTNTANYRLTGFMVEDDLGLGQNALSVGLGGISASGNGGFNRMTDTFNKFSRFQVDASGNVHNGIHGYAGYWNGGTGEGNSALLYEPYFCLVNPNGSAYIYPSSVSRWNNAASFAENFDGTVHVGYGLSGDGTVGSPLAAVGASAYVSSTSQTSTFEVGAGGLKLSFDNTNSATYNSFAATISAMDTAGNLQKMTQVNYDGMYVSAHTGNSGVASVDESGFKAIVWGSYSATLSPSSLELSNGSKTVTIDANLFDSLTAWASANGWTP